MSLTTQLNNQFLLSMPHLQSDYFSGSLIYICDHSEEGAMGLVVNKFSDFDFAEILEQLDIEPSISGLDQVPVYAGGPVKNDRGFLLHSAAAGNWKSTLQLRDDLFLSTSIDILEALAQGKGPSDYLITLGYAGWGPGQLEGEIGNNLWLSCPANLDILFKTDPEQRLDAAAKQLGIDINLLSDQAGHA
ncbi:MAG: YqgE/AlgH family protein [Oceanospirillaceae bacterium]|nr:YqgE/AlgH family protein [Oceanospirillaceae bacterium]